MKKRIVFLFSRCLLIWLMCFLSCNQREIKKDQEIKNDLISKYLSIAKDKSQIEEVRKENLNIIYGLIDNLDNENKKRIVLNELAVVYFEMEDYEKYKSLIEKSLEIAKKENDSTSMAKSYFNLGLYYRKRQLDSAYINFYRAEKVFSEFDKKGIRNPVDYAFDYGKVLIDLAKLSKDVKDYVGSEALTIQAIERFKLSENSTFLPLCYTTLGHVSKSLEKYDEAVEYHQKSIEYAKQINKGSLYEIIGNNNIGTVYKSQGNYEKAKYYYKKALSSLELSGKNPRRYALYMDNLAYVNFLSDDYTDIPDIFYKTLRIRDSIDDKRGIATNTLHLAEYYKKIGVDTLARSFAERAKAISEEINNNDELLQSYQILSKVSGPEEGLDYAQKYISLNDSLIKEERAFRDKFARIRFETEQKEEKIVEISRKNQFLVIITLGLALLSLLGYVIFRQRQRNKELEFSQKQQETNEEIYRLLLTQQAKLEEGRKMEQQRMSEELHDGVLGRLFGVRLSLDGINQRANDGFTDSRNKYIEELKSIEKEIRMISHDLGSDTFNKDIAYVDVVESLIKDLCTVHNVQFNFDSNEDINWEAVDDPKKVNLFRIIQESLQNIFKHAKADHVKITFDYDYDINEIKLQIEDNGIGFNKEKVKRGIGLKNITSRVKQMNGNVDFDSVIGEGAKVFVGVPVSDLVIAKKKKPAFSIAP